MANINVSVTDPTVNVTEIVSNVTVTDVEANAIVGNIVTTSSNISVVNTQSNVTVAQAVGLSNLEVRSAFTANTPITLDYETGDLGFNASAYPLSAQSLTSTSTISSVSNTTVGDGLTVTNNASIGQNLIVGGSATIGGNASVANLTSAGIINGTLKDIHLSYYDAGNVSGNVTLDVANGPVQKIRLTNNITGLTFTGATAAQPITVIIQQDSLGFWQIDTSTFASNWTAWKFVNNFKTLTTTGNAYDVMSVTYDGTNYYASVVNFFQSLITNSELANSNVVINGVTIPLGSNATLTTSNIAEGTNLYFTNARARTAIDPVSPLFFSGDRLNLNANITFDSVLINNAYKRTSTALIAVASPGYNAFNAQGPVVIEQERSSYPVSFTVKTLSGFNILRAAETTERIVSIDGNLTQANGSITTTGNVQGNYFIGNGSLLTGVSGLTNAQVLSYIATQPLTVGGNLTVNGNINATGNINYQNVTDLYVTDQKITLNSNAATNANVQIIANRPTATSTELKWNEQTDRWTFTNDGTTYYNMPTSTTDLAEGTNLYYTTDRANTAIDAYQGNINTVGTINATDLTATNNVFALGALHSPDGSNIQYVRAWNVNYESTNTASSLNVLLESESNNRIAISSSGAIRYVPATRTLFVTDGTIGSNDNNLQGNNLSLLGNVTAGGRISATGNVQGAYFIGNGSQLTGIISAVQSVNGQTGIVVLDTDDIAEGSANLYYTTARANTAIANKLIDSSQKKIFNAAIQDLYLTPDVANATGGYYMPNIPGNVGDVLQLTGSDQAGWQRLDTSDVDEGANLYFTTARANSAIYDYIIGSENITVNSFAFSLDNAIDNVNSITS